MLKSRAKIYSKMVRKKRQREAPVDFGIAGLGLGRGVGERVNPIPEGVIGLKEEDLPYMTNVLNMCRIVRIGQIYFTVLSRLGVSMFRNIFTFLLYVRCH